MLEEFIRNKVEGSVVATEPFPFLYIQDFFPKDYYRKLESIFPEDKYLTSINDKKYKPLDTVIVGRKTLTIFNSDITYQELEGYPFAKEARAFRKWSRDFLVPLIAYKLNVPMATSSWDDTRFVVDTEGYVKHPHTDNPQKLFSILIYMSNSKCGTTIVKPKDPDFKDSYGNDHKFGQFDMAFDPPFVPNALIAFPRTDTSFHCVRRLESGEYRRAIHINIRR